MCGATGIPAPRSVTFAAGSFWFALYYEPAFLYLPACRDRIEGTHWRFSARSPTQDPPLKALGLPQAATLPPKAELRGRGPRGAICGGERFAGAAVQFTVWGTVQRTRGGPALGGCRALGGPSTRRELGCIIIRGEKVDGQQTAPELSATEHRNGLSISPPIRPSETLFPPPCSSTLPHSQGQHSLLRNSEAVPFHCRGRADLSNPNSHHYRPFPPATPPPHLPTCDAFPSALLLEPAPIRHSLLDWDQRSDLHLPSFRDL